MVIGLVQLNFSFVTVAGMVLNSALVPGDRVLEIVPLETMTGVNKLYSSIKTTMG